MFEPPQNVPKFLRPERRIVRPQLIAREEDGFVLLAVLFMLVILLLTLSIAAPTVATDLRRDKEIETVHRGMQYARAIRIYYRKFGRYPNTIDQLMNTENQRFLRKRYLDPMTGKDDWRIIHFGESQLLANSAGQIGTPAANMPGASPIGGNGIGNGAFGSSGTGIASSTPGFGSSGSGFGGGSSFGSSGDNGSSAIGGTSPSGSAFGSSGTSSSGETGTGTGSAPFGTPGATVGGAPIVGVGLPSTKASIKIYKKQSHYNQWEFVYDPNSDLGGALGQNGTGGVGVPQTGMTNGIGGNSSGLGNGNSTGLGNGSGGFGGTSGIGNSPGFGSSPGIGGPPETPPNPTNPSDGSSSPP